MYPRGGALILYGHRITDDDEGYLQGLRPQWFDDQIAYLSRNFEIIPLAELVRCIREHKPVPRKSVILTLDDGFRDNLEHGLPILERYHAPATIFLVTGSISTGALPWSQRLGVLFQRSSLGGFEHPLFQPAVVDLSTPMRRRKAYLGTKEVMKTLGHIERERVLKELAALLGVEAPLDRMLSWADVRAMQARGVDFGVHTYSHSLLGRVPSADARWEIERSILDFQDNLGYRSPFFCFPAGSLTPDLVSLVAELGFQSCFQPGMPRVVTLNGTGNAFSLGRLGLPNGPAALLEAELDGPIPLMRSAKRGLVRAIGLG